MGEREYNAGWSCWYHLVIEISQHHQCPLLGYAYPALRWRSLMPLCALPPDPMSTTADQGNGVLSGRHRRHTGDRKHRQFKLFRRISKQYTEQLKSFQGHFELLVTQTHMYVHYAYYHAVWEIRHSTCHTAHLDYIVPFPLHYPIPRWSYKHQPTVLHLRV